MESWEMKDGCGNEAFIKDSLCSITWSTWC